VSRKFQDMRATSGSRLETARFASKFIVKRSGYVLRHAMLCLNAPRAAAPRAAPLTPVPQPAPTLAIKITGGIGDAIIAARLMRDLRDAAGHFAFDVYANDPAVIDWIFAPVAGFGKSYSVFLFDRRRPDYDAAMYVSHFVKIFSAREDAFSGAPVLRAALQAAITFEGRIRDYVAQHPLRDNHLARFALGQKLDRMSLAYAMFGIPKGPDRLALAVNEAGLQKFNLRPGAYITVHNGFDENMVVLGRASTKIYPGFAQVVAALRRDFPNLPVVQLGVPATSRPIAGVDRALIGQTTLPEAAALIKHAAWHIDVESGLVHLARCFGTPCTVIFGPTSVAYFGYRENQNIPPSACGDCWWLTETWMAKCPKGHAVPVCTQQDPQRIAQTVRDALPAQSAQAAAAELLAG
jgi:hypothetical protein